MKTETIRKYAYITVTALGICTVGYLFLRYVFIYVCPFLLGFAISASAKRPAVFLSQKTKISEIVFNVFLSVLFSFGVMAGLGALVYRGCADGVSFLTSLSENGAIDRAVSALSERFSTLFSNLKLDVDVKTSVTTAGRELITASASKLATFLTGAVGAIPKILLFAFITGISAVYFAIDGKSIGEKITSVCPEKITHTLCRIKDGVFGAVFKYLRVYSLLAVITFGLMSLGFVILKIDYALLIAVIVALLDALPVIGVGTVLVPWAIYEFAVGNVPLGIGLLILYGINEILRQIIEPRLIGKSLGIHPLLSLFLIYIGYALFGILGLFLLPVLAATVEACLKLRKTTPKIT